ncbi:MAG TPA: ABC transporter substrate-binding protein [Firmicutes bacterium]|nr:ABC transporter substrate-binding protein [Bacillota bacterium]
MKRFARIASKVAVLLMTVLMLLSLGAGCGEGTGDPEDKTELIIGLGRDFFYGPEDRSFLHGSTNVWESLTYLNENLVAEPWLAESITPSADGKVWTFALREGITFHDGSALDAEVVQKNLLRLSRHPATSEAYRDLDEIVVTGPLTVEVKLAVPSPSFPELISYFNSAIFSAKALDDDGTRLEAPVGTGPYIFDERGEDTIYLKAFEDYWNGTPSIEKVVFHHIPDENTRIAALQSGEVDVLADVGVILPEQVPLLEADPNIQLFTADVLTSVYLIFQTEKAPFNKPELRQAVSLLIEREELVEKLLEGYGKPAVGLLSPLAETWNNPAAAPTCDPSAAKELFEKNLADDENEIEILVNANWARRWPMLSIAQYLQTELGNLGFTATLRNLEMGAFNDAAESGEFHLSLSPWTGSEPDDFFSEWIHSEGGFNSSRGINFSNAQADELIRKAAGEMDLEKRRGLYADLQILVAENAPIVPLYHDVTVYATRKNVEDFTIDFEFRPDLHKARLR